MRPPNGTTPPIPSPTAPTVTMPIRPSAAVRSAYSPSRPMCVECRTAAIATPCCRARPMAHSSANIVECWPNPRWASTRRGDPAVLDEDGARRGHDDAPVHVADVLRHADDAVRIVAGQVRAHQVAPELLRHVGVRAHAAGDGGDELPHRIGRAEHGGSVIGHERGLRSGKMMAPSIIARRVAGARGSNASRPARPAPSGRRPRRALPLGPSGGRPPGRSARASSITMRRPR